MVDKGIVTPIAYSRTLSFVLLYAMLIGLYSLFPVLKEYSPYRDFADLPAEIHAALTLVLGWLLVFRTNTAYARWWEARTMWGTLVNASRNVAVKVTSLGRVPDADLQPARRILTNFPRLLRDHLRSEVVLEEFHDLAVDGQTFAHAPSELVRRMYLLLNRWRVAGQIDGFDLLLIDQDLLRLLDVCGGCEKIRNTRIVKSYRIFSRQCVFLFLATFPWGIVNEFGGWTIPLTIITAYFMLGLETVAEHVEEPFGYDEDDLDLDGLCNVIAESVNEIFDQHSRPPATS